MLTTALALAENLLRSKFYRTPNVKRHLRLNERDLGYDCIAELFERDGKGQLIHFKTYFSNFEFHALSHQEILLHFRRLISSAVNQNLMQVYRDFDPSLGKIIRNIKLAITAHKTFIEIDRFDEPCIAPIHCDLQEHLPALDQSVVFEMLSSHIRGREFVPEILSVYSRVIRSQNEYRRIIPLITIALTFRALFVAKQDHQPSSDNSAVSNFETLEIMQNSINQIKAAVLLHTNGAQKIKSDTVEIYFTTIYNVLLAKMNETNGSADSLYEGLKQHFVHLDVCDYRKCHRTKLEYYYKLCREAIASELLERKIL
ncbi:MAG: hypothetical protein PHP42_02980 [Bacteroidota bacterium]|nr:hypothetical protein [Bacteroidota bacterium]